MAWAKIDDRFFSHPKVRRAGKDAVLLYLAGLTYCNEHLTDGFIPEESLPFLGIAAFVDDVKQSVSKLLDVCLWHVASKDQANGYVVHDYFEHNPTREQVEITKVARAEAGRKGGQAPKTPKVPDSKQNASKLPSKTEAKAKQNGSKTEAISPPLLTLPKGSGAPLAEIALYHETIGKYPPKALYERVTATLQKKSDGPFMRQCYEEWLARGYNGASLQWLFDWYAKGEIPPTKGRNGAHETLPTAAPFAAEVY